MANAFVFRPAFLKAPKELSECQLFFVQINSMCVLILEDLKCFNLLSKLSKIEF